MLSAVISHVLCVWNSIPGVCVSLRRGLCVSAELTSSVAVWYLTLRVQGSKAMELIDITGVCGPVRQGEAGVLGNSNRLGEQVLDQVRAGETTGPAR